MAFTKTRQPEDRDTARGHAAKALLLAALLLAALLLASCAPSPPPVSRFAEPELVVRRSAPPSDAPKSGECRARDDTPARVETVTEHLRVPERRDADGTVLSPAGYRTVTHQRIVEDRASIWFETPCPEVMTRAFIISLQRALKVRGLYAQAPSGTLDAPTRAAIRRFQAEQGLDSGVLSIAAAKRLGLVRYSRAEALRTGGSGT
ncbi:peptidoglycan-binding domain-containing protein [Profundibacterium mesophilum]|uniref:Peptidoglycan binding domain containing protein n=1 Tax=Profundibacterium mesophilum KAUST100406-0324 TaxID=1037889 RepID=A0A921NVL9_9RHOB|nr:peptidoglycan-binding domain-containing protein [Profundibacterium mesophilum]KAF0676136.1 putative peptidoglycan binding domain containing protein [Profundibacterium mesophilum KAUST100406-0324]